MKLYLDKNTISYNYMLARNLPLIILLLAVLLLNSCSQHNKLSVTQAQPQQLIAQVDFTGYQSNKKNSINVSPNINSYHTFKVSQPYSLPLDAQTNSHSEDLWGEIVSRFEFYDNKKIEPRTKYFIDNIAKNAQTFRELTSQAKPYLFYIFSELTKNGLPGEIALLPFVESRFQPHAISKVGASGLWQFTSSTGDFYGLRQNKWYDERFNIVEATQAAINLLLDMYTEFHSWPIALAAYNYGIGNLKRAIRKNQKLGLATDYRSLPLPAETKNYVPKLLAYAHIIANIKKYPKLRLSKIKNKPLLTTIEIKDSFSINTLANASKLTEIRFRHMNPGFKKWIIPPKEKHKLLIPIKHQNHFEKYLSKNGHMGDWLSYTVQSGDTLYDIAKSYATKIQVLLEANKLKKTTIHPGQEIIVPKFMKASQGYSGRT